MNSLRGALKCSKVFNVFVFISSAQNQKVWVQSSSQTCFITIEKTWILNLESKATATIVLSYMPASKFIQKIHFFHEVLILFIVCLQPGRERRWRNLSCAASVIRSSEWSPVIQGNRSGLMPFHLLAHCNKSPQQLSICTLSFTHSPLKHALLYRENKSSTTSLLFSLAVKHS